MGSETGKRGSVVGLSTRGTRDWKARCGGTVDTWDQRPESELVWWDCQTRRTRLLLPAVRTSKTFSRSDYRHVFQTDRIAMSVGLNSRRYVGQRNDAWHPGIHWPARNLSLLPHSAYFCPAALKEPACRDCPRTDRPFSD